jgi:hypothetical protein
VLVQEPPYSEKATQAAAEKAAIARIGEAGVVVLVAGGAGMPAAAGGGS